MTMYNFSKKMYTEVTNQMSNMFEQFTTINTIKVFIYFLFVQSLGRKESNVQLAEKEECFQTGDSPEISSVKKSIKNTQKCQKTEKIRKKSKNVKKKIIKSSKNENKQKKYKNLKTQKNLKIKNIKMESCEKESCTMESFKYRSPINELSRRKRIRRRRIRKGISERIRKRRNFRKCLILMTGIIMGQNRIDFHPSLIQDSLRESWETYKSDINVSSMELELKVGGGTSTSNWQGKECLQRAGLVNCVDWNRDIGKQHFTSAKMRNKNVKMRNGNRNSSCLKIVDWNIGNRYWPNKLEEIKLLTLQTVPDLLFVTEANLMQGTPDHLKEIPGYDIILPKSMEALGYSRIVLLVRKGLKVHLLEQHMEDDLAAIWIRVGNSRKNPTHVGGIYREHRLLCQPVPNRSVNFQEERWGRILKNWRNEAKDAKCLVIGDLNLDFVNWEHPVYNESMIEKTKEVIELIGFTQLVKMITRTWVDTADSIVDHIWTNAPERIRSHENQVRGTSDHNMIMTSFDTKVRNNICHEVRKRRRHDFNVERYRERLKNVDWTDLFNSDNVDTINDILEKEIRDALEETAPMVMIQPRKSYKNWLEDRTKLKMKDRDTAREVARMTKLPEDWKNIENYGMNVPRKS